MQSYLSSIVKSKKTLIFFLSILIVFSFLSFSFSAMAECSPLIGDPSGCIPPSPNNKSLMQIAVDVLNAALSLVFLIVLGFLVYGGYYWMVSGGNEEKIRTARKILGSSMVGLLIILASLSITNFIVAAIGGTVVTPTGTNLTSRSFTDILTDIINAALSLVGLIALGSTIYGGFRWMTAGGNEENVSDAKRILSASVIGLVVIIISWSIINFIFSIFNP